MEATDLYYAQPITKVHGPCHHVNVPPVSWDGLVIKLTVMHLIAHKIPYAMRYIMVNLITSPSLEPGSTLT